MKKKFNKDKIKSILFYIGSFIYFTFLGLMMYNGFTYNKYGMGEHYEIKALLFVLTLCYLMLFGGSCYIRYLEKELDKADKELYDLKQEISVKEWARILHNRKYGKDEEEI